MPRYKIETTTMVRRVYVVDAKSGQDAEDLIDVNGDRYLVHEEDVGEDVDDVSVIKPEPTK